MADADAADAADAPRRTANRLALAAFLAFVALRIPVLLSYQDTWYPFEVHAGTIATALLDGVDLHGSRLPIVPHARGGVLFGLLLTPLYAAFGVQAIVMKSLPVVWNGLAAALLVRLLARSGRGAAAVAATILFSIAPPMLVKLSTIAIASHLDSMLFFVLALTCAARFARAPSGGAAAGLGLAVGAAGFFHLQALLPCLLVAAFSLPRFVRAGARPAAAAIVGACLGAAPSFCFDGGNTALLTASLGSSVEDDSARAPAAPPPPLFKLAALLRHDFAYALEFGESGRIGSVLGGVVAALLALGLLVAARADRDALREWLRLAPRSDRGPPYAFLFLLHAVGVVVLYAISHAQHQQEIAAGLTNRHLAPVFFSCLAAAALALGSVARTPKRAAVFAIVLASPSLLALPAICETSDANRLPHRGECYEWFWGQIDPSLRADADRAIRLVERVDRGPVALRPFRFRLEVVAPGPDDASPGAVADRVRQLPALPTKAHGYAAVNLGRRAAGRMFVFDASWAKVVAPLNAETRAWFLRGIGLAIEPPRLALREIGPEFGVRVTRLLRAATASDAERILEGVGFQLGSVFDPYNVNLRNRMASLDFLEAGRDAALWRGVGWGATTRNLATPTRVPADHVLLRYVPSSCRGEFEDAFTLRRLP